MVALGLLRCCFEGWVLLILKYRDDNVFLSYGRGTEVPRCLRKEYMKNQDWNMLAR
jgi:hypothetical protein